VVMLSTAIGHICRRYYRSIDRREYTPQEMLSALTNERTASQSLRVHGGPGTFTTRRFMPAQSAISSAMSTLNSAWLHRKPYGRYDAEFIARREVVAIVCLCRAWRLVRRDRFVSWLKTKLDSGPWKGQEEIQHHELASSLPRRTCTSPWLPPTPRCRLLVLNHLTLTGLPRRLGCPHVMSIPLLWNEVIWEKSWGTVWEGI